MREDCMELGPITSSRREECLPRIVGRPSVRDKIEKSRLYIYQGGWCSSSRGIEWHSNIFIKSVWTWKSHLRLYLSEVYSRNVFRRREYFEYLLQFSIIRNSFRFFFFEKQLRTIRSRKNEVLTSLKSWFLLNSRHEYSYVLTSDLFARLNFTLNFNVNW